MPENADDPGAAPPAGSTEGGSGPPHLADPRALTILTTEHWGLLTARSLVYNEAFARGAMFLTFLSASLVALGFISGGGVPNRDLPLIVIAILSLDLFVGVATLGRLAGMGREEFQALQGMNRLRHAYLEMVPSLEPYIVASPYDDPNSVLGVYVTTAERPGVLYAVLHGLTTMVGLVGVLVAALVGGIVAALAIALGGDGRLALLAGVVAGVVAAVVLASGTVRVFEGATRSIRPRFPAPGIDATPVRPPSRRNT